MYYINQSTRTQFFSFSLGRGRAINCSDHNLSWHSSFHTSIYISLKHQWHKLHLACKTKYSCWTICFELLMKRGHVACCRISRFFVEKKKKKKHVHFCNWRTMTWLKIFQTKNVRIK